MFQDYYHRLQFLLEMLDLTLGEGMTESASFKEDIHFILEDNDLEPEDQEGWESAIRMISYFGDQFKMMREHVQDIRRPLGKVDQQQEEAA